MTKEKILKEAEKANGYSVYGKGGDKYNAFNEGFVSGVEYATQEKQGWVKTEYVPYQLCPKCNGQGSVSKPGWVPGDVDQWTSSAVTHLCDICNGAKIIPMYVLPQKPEV